MKRVLITGANSYIGTSFEKYITDNFPNNYVIDTVDMIDGSWREKSFAGYDVIFHVAGIAHQKETKKNGALYFKVNRDLAVNTAIKAKSDGVRQFIYLSSMSVYGLLEGVITKETQPNPRNNYGKSKWEAEQEITSLSDAHFTVSILRPPMVYGKGCKGNFNTLCCLVRMSPIFPYLNNKRSMIYIDNLSSFVKFCIDNLLSGVYLPQNREYVSTMKMVKGIAVAMNKRIWFEHISGVLVWVLRMFCPIIKKAFGSLIYEDTEKFNFDYVVVDNEQSFIRSIVGDRG